MFKILDEVPSSLGTTVVWAELPITIAFATLSELLKLSILGLSGTTLICNVLVDDPLLTTLA